MRGNNCGVNSGVGVIQRSALKRVRPRLKSALCGNIGALQKIVHLTPQPLSSFDLFSP
jgi:hypothetical protein